MNQVLMQLNTISSNLSFRTIEFEDKPFLLHLYTSTRQDLTKHLATSVYEKIIAFQYEMQDTQFRTQYPNGNFFLILLDDEKIGRIYLSEDFEKITVVEVALVSENRNKGFGTIIFNEIIRFAKANNKELQLQVARSNSAINFYQKLGFNIAHQNELNNFMSLN